MTTKPRRECTCTAVRPNIPLHKWTSQEQLRIKLALRARAVSQLATQCASGLQRSFCVVAGGIGGGRHVERGCCLFGQCIDHRPSRCGRVVAACHALAPECCAWSDARGDATRGRTNVRKNHPGSCVRRVHSIDALTRHGGGQTLSCTPCPTSHGGRSMER